LLSTAAHWYSARKKPLVGAQRTIKRDFDGKSCFGQMAPGALRQVSSLVGASAGC
jgi:hypothetical protein